MPRYIGERRGEIYYQRDGKWHHCRDNGRCFDSLESAQRDFNKVCPKAPADDFFIGAFLLSYYYTVLEIGRRNLWHIL